MTLKPASRLSNCNQEWRRGGGASLLPRRSLSIAVAVVCAFLSGSVAGCGGNGGGAAVQTNRAIPATSSSIVAVDCKRQRAYVPLPDLNADLHGQVAVLDLSVDPDQGNPLLKIIDIGLIALPRATAVDIKSGTVFVLADDVVNTGVLLLINEADDSLSSFPFPAGSRPSETSGIVFDPKNNTALVSMSDSLFDCTNGAGGCTGMAVFDVANHSFGPLVLSLIEINSFGLNPAANVAIGSVDPFAFLLALDLDVAEPIPCELDDENVKNLFADPDGIAVDPSTGIWVAGNYESPTTSVINLHRSEFTGPGTLDCHLNEGGTPPNSVNHDTGTGAEGMPGVAINPVTHQAFMTAQPGNQIALLSLPSSPVKQLDASKVKSVNSTIPNDPQGLLFAAANFPYGTVVDSCHNLGYVLDNDWHFLVQIDLTKFRRDPAAISTALPPGTCAGVSTSFQCDNGNGVKFFPLPGFAGASAHHLPAIFSDQAFKARKRAKRHR